MIKIVGLCNDNMKAAERMYAASYPDRRHPTRMTIKALLRRAQQGHLKRNRNKTGPPENKILVTLAAVERNPHISTRMIQNEHGIPQRTVSRILRLEKFHPYHITLTQKLQAGDFHRRLQFCNWARNKYRTDPSFFMHVLFTDEATFNNRGELNRHNCHYWSNNNPQWQRSVEHQHQWSINVWGGIIGTHVIGPHYFEGHLNREIYLQFLQNELPNLLEDVNLHIRRRMWWQQDGAPAHRSRLTVTYLNEKFHRRWIGIGSQTQEWPPRSPDLTPLDFFLWGYVKDKVCATQPTTIADMKLRIERAFRDITDGTLQRVENNFRLRVTQCIDQNGGVFEHLR